MMYHCISFGNKQKILSFLNDSIIPRSNRHDRKRPCIAVFCRITCARITIVYLRVVYGEIQPYTERKTTVYDSCVRNPYAVSVFLRISPSTIVSLLIQSRRYTIVIRTQVIRQKTVVYDCKGIVDGRLRPHTEPVILDLGIC